MHTVSNQALNEPCEEHLINGGGGVTVHAWITLAFLFQELFRSDHYSHMSPSKITGRCHVMSVRDYFKFKPEVWRFSVSFIKIILFALRCHFDLIPVL